MLFGIQSLDSHWNEESTSKTSNVIAFRWLNNNELLFWWNQTPLQVKPLKFPKMSPHLSPFSTTQQSKPSQHYRVTLETCDLWDILLTIFDHNFWWTFLMTIFDDNCWWQLLMTIFDENFWQFWQIFGKHLRFAENCQIFRKFQFF